MNLNTQKRIAQKALRVGMNRIHFDNTRLDEIKEAITTADIRSLIKDGAITAKPSQGNSRARARKIKIQKSKGRRQGQGSRKGAMYARLPKKDRWMSKIRAQRKFLKSIKGKKIVSREQFKDLVVKSSSGVFRSVRHIKLHIDKLKGK